MNFYILVQIPTDSKQGDSENRKTMNPEMKWSNEIF